LAQRHAAALEGLARDATARGEIVAAAGWWRQLAQVEPLNARVAVCYMEALCAAGDRPSALRFARAYETLLLQEFDTGPDPAVVAAAERLRQLPAGEPAVAMPAVPAIAVLPLVNLTPGGENEYFSDGLTDELTTALARVPGLRVASRTSTNALHGKGLDARELADRLGVGALVEGSVRKVGNRIRLSARLINAADGCQLWSETYERTLEDVFLLEEQLSRAIADALPLAAGPVRAPLVRRSTAVLDAYTLYLRGRYAAHKRTPEGLSLGIEYFEQAVELDPGYALGYAGLAECWAILGFAPEFVPVSAPEAAPRARSAALEALQLDPELAQAHTWLGVVHFLYDWDWTAAEAEFRRSIQLDPGYALAETWYAMLLNTLGRHEESVRRVLHAEAIEPLSFQNRLCVGRCYYFGRRYEQAHGALTAILKDEPGHPLTTSWLARTLCAMGRLAEALEILERLPPQYQTAYIRSVVAYALAGAGRAEEARVMCVALERDAEERRCPVTYLAGALEFLGKRDLALEILEKAFRRRDCFMPWLRSEPIHDPVRDHPRFQRLVAELRLTPVPRTDPALPAGRS
jgi:serine/threonine-protein kinase